MKRKDLRIAIVLVTTALVLIGFVLFADNVLLNPQAETYTYNHFEFVKKQGLWVTQVQINDKLIVIPLHYGPRETEHIRISGKLDDSFNIDPIYVTFDPESQNQSFVALSAAELTRNLAEGLKRNAIAACSENKTLACATRPIINCDNTNESVIYLKQSETAAVEFDNNCIIVKGKDSDMVKAVDQLLLYWYGIIP